MLAGGASSRMGRDKTQLPWGGSTLLEHALAKLSHAGFTPGIAGLREPIPASVPCIPDNFPGDGPLAGMEAALRSLAHEPTQPVLFLPVDLPLLPPSFLRTLGERAELSNAAATVPFACGRAQPLCSVLTSGLANAFARALEEGDRKVMRVFAKAAGSGFDTFEVETLASLEGWQPHRWFSNLNRPADYCRVRSAAQFEASPGRQA